MALIHDRRIGAARKPLVTGIRLALVMAVSGLALAAHSQRADAGSICEYDNDDNVICQQQHQGTYHNAQAVKQVVNGRVGPDGNPLQTEPVQYAPTDPVEDPAANAIIDEAVSTATNGQSLVWNAWVDTSFIYTDRDHSMFSYDGPMVTASVGIDRLIAEATVIGLLFNYEYVDFDTAVGGASGSLESDSFGIGAYGGSALTENLVADAMFIYSWLDNDVVDLFGANSYDSRRIQAAANLTGYWFNEAWRYSPAIGLTWSSEKQDSYAGGAAPSRTLESGVALASFQIGRTHYYSETRWIEPWMGVSAEWEFHTSGPSGGVPGMELDPFDIRILGGLNTQISEAVSANIRADIAGIVRDDYLTGSVGGQLAVRF